jgi:polar amino acid transport system substrate-binding protein
MKKLFQTLTVSLMTVLVTVALTGCEASNVFTFTIDSHFSEYIVMGTSADYPPYESLAEVDGKRTVVGIDIEIAKHIAAALGKNLKVINKGFDFLLEDLEAGKVDFVMAGMTPTDERAQIVDFSSVYYEAVQVILIQAAKQSVFTDIDSLNRATVKVGAQLGTIQQDLVEENFPLAQAVIVQNIPDLVLQLQEGQIQGVVMEKPVADGYVAHMSGLIIADIAIGDPDGGSAVAVQKGDSVLLATINAVLAELETEGTIEKIVVEAIQNNGSDVK